MANLAAQPTRSAESASIQARVLQRLAQEERVLQSRDRTSYRGDMPGGLIYLKATVGRGRQLRSA